MNDIAKNGYRKENKCPYCGYFCDSAVMTDDESIKPQQGDISFCLKCTECSLFGENMKLEKFNIDSIKDTYERNRLKIIQVKMNKFYSEFPELEICDR